VAKLSKLLDQLSRAACNDAEVKKSHKKLAIKAAISCGLLAFIYSQVDLPALLHILRQLSALICIALIALYTAGQIVSALKWRIFLAGVGLKRSRSQAVGAYFLGMFVNSFGLGTVGGDVTRALVIRPDKGKRTAALATVVADRVHGLGVLVVIGLLALAIVRPDSVPRILVYGGIAGVLLIVAGWLAGPALLMRIFPLEHRYGTAAIRVAGAFPKTPRELITASLLSSLLHLFQIVMHILIGHQLGAGLSIGQYFALVPIVNIASSFPISINGLGVREAMYLAMFVPAGVSREVAVAFGAVWFVTITLVSALGSIVLAPLAAEQNVLDEDMIADRSALPD
jgi:glycosyltransferase 2 family protein